MGQPGGANLHQCQQWYGEPGEVKHFSSRRNRKSIPTNVGTIPQVAASETGVAQTRPSHFAMRKALRNGRPHILRERVGP